MRKWFTLVVLGLAIGVVLSLLPTPVVPAQEPTPTPPSPTWTPGPAPPKAPTPTATTAPSASARKPGPAGGFIKLCVQLTPSALWDTVDWQDLWTVVEWQDARGTWHDVEGWQGGLDEVVTGDGGEFVGHKTWWVVKSDLGTGPFRWLVYEGRQGRRLATSVPFNLPDTKGRTVRVEVSLVP
jgi:hypothetical protein